MKKSMIVFVFVVLAICCLFTQTKHKSMIGYSLDNLEALAQTEVKLYQINDCFLDVEEDANGLYNQPDCNGYMSNTPNIVYECKYVKTNLVTSTATGKCYVNLSK